MRARATLGPNLRLLLLLAPGVGFLLLFFGSPLFLALLSSFGIGGVGKTEGFTLEHYRLLFAERIYRDALVFSFYLAIVPTLVSLAVALPLAVALQANFAFRKLFQTLYKIPLVIPTIVAAFLVMVFFDRGGLLSRALMPFGLSMPKLVRDEMAIGVIIATAWKAVPFMTLIIGGAVASIPAEVTQAARTLGASRLKVFAHIQLPLALPGITAASLLTFIGGTGAFVIPNLLGPIYPQPLSVYMYENAYFENRWNLVAAMGTTLSVVACLVLVAYYRLTAGLRAAYGGEAR